MRLNHTRFVDTDRGRFHVRLDHSGDVPVVLLHGWPESGYCWTRLADKVDGAFQLIAPDLRGLGDSERTPGVENYRKQALARDMLGLLDALDIESCHLVGHDWGGVVAQEMALAAPERFTRLALMNIPVINNLRDNLAVLRDARLTGNPFLWYQHFQQQADLPEQLIPGNEEAWLSYFLRFSSGEAFPQDAMREYVRAYRIPDTPATGANYYRAMAQDAERWAGLGETVIPLDTLYVYGEKDPVIVPEYLEHAEDCFRSLDMQRIDAGHFVQEEYPGKVAGVLDHFLNRGIA